jgi:geranylgeranyl diphosphate synthase type I
MLDVRWGSSGGDVSEKDVLELYRYKTGRYTFSLPLSSGALLAGADEQQRQRLEHIGELLGIVFQLRDDELGLYGDEKALGKPIGSDVREGKKTPFYLKLMDRVEDEEREKLLGIFGNAEAAGEDIERVRSLVESLGVRDEIVKSCERLSREASAEIESLEGVNGEAYRILEELLDYGLKRKS